MKARMEILELSDTKGKVLLIEDDEVIKFSVDGGLLNVDYPKRSNILPGQIRDFLTRDRGVSSALISAMSYF